MSSSLSIKGRLAPRKLALLYVILVVSMCFSLLYGWVPIFQKQAYIATLAFLSSLLIVPTYFRTRLFILTIIYAVVVLLNAQMGDEYTEGKEVMDGLLLIMSGSISFYIMKSDDQRVKKWICILIMMILLIQTIPAILFYFTSQDTIKTVVTAIFHNDTDLEWGQLYRMGIMSYPMIHSLPVLVPPQIMWLRSRGISKFWKTVCFITLLNIFLLSYIYDVTTVQFLVLFCIAASLLIYPNQNQRNRKRILIASVLMLPILLSTNLQLGMLRGVEYFAPGEMKEKVADIRYDMIHDSETGDMANRQNLYALSFETFLTSPLVGTDDYTRIGGHSSIIDRMAAFGLLGFVPFILVLILATFQCRTCLPSSSRWYFTICVISFAVMQLMKSMCHVEEWLMYLVVAPSLLSLDPPLIGLSHHKR